MTLEIADSTNIQVAARCMHPGVAYGAGTVSVAVAVSVVPV